MRKSLTFLLTALFLVTAATAQSTLVTDSFAKVSDVELHYRIYGKGDPLVLLHGSLESMEDWNHQVV
ncbi:MAG TPA: alpha/beta hydrolase, partial [Chitinophagales bacterium]|nr:alpha/beta hydrolase [Chitinophagales bacterium]